MSQFSLAADSSQITCFETCNRMYFYKYRLNIEPREIIHTAFSKGTIIHGLAERYYNRIYEGWNTALKFAVDSYREDREKLGLGVDNTTFESLLARFLLYASLHTNDLMPLVKDGKPAVEQGFSIPIVDNKYFLFVLEGRIDLVIKFNDLKVVVDHKTQNQKKAFHARTIQFLNYALALNTNRVMINVIGLQEKFKPGFIFRNLFYYSHDYLLHWREQLTSIFYRMANAIIQNDFPMNLSACPGKYPQPCDYCSLCEEANPNIVSNIIKIKYKEVEPWTPWKEE